MTDGWQTDSNYPQHDYRNNLHSHTRTADTFKEREEDGSRHTSYSNIIHMND